MGQVDPWLQIDLQLTATVSRVVIWHRSDCCGDRNTVAKIHLKDSSGNTLHTETVTGPGPKSTFNFPPVENVTTIRIAMENTAPTLSSLVFAEVRRLLALSNDSFGHI